MPLFETITDLAKGGELLRRRPYGVIEVADGRFRRVLLRPFPAIVSAPDMRLIGGWRHRHQAGDRVRLYYNQPRRFPSFLVLKYCESRGIPAWQPLPARSPCSTRSARLKQSDALLCDVANGRITSKVLSRWGWEPHCPSWFHRHYVKRFYGVYPSPPSWICAPAIT